jgi:F0F1-type ATP synthase membrane subunit c/vacuolar-type H+-ATPase subunit K
VQRKGLEHGGRDRSTSRNRRRAKIPNVIALCVILAAGLAAVAAGWLLWWSAHRSALWNFVAAIVLGIATLAGAVGIGYLIVRWSAPL